MLTRTVYRRHIFEMVEELSDAVFWTLILCLFFIPAGILFDYHRIWGFCLLSFFPIAKFFIEVLNWWNEKYIVEVSPDSEVLRKQWGIINRKEIKDPMKIVSVFKEEPLHMRLIGACRVKVTSASNAYIEGRLVPIAFWEEVDRITSGLRKIAKAEATGNVTLDMARMAPEFVAAGLMSDVVARAFIEETYSAMWRQTA